MELRVITLENGMKVVRGVGDRPAPTPEQSAFAAELGRVAEAAKQAEASGSSKMQAAWDCMTPSSKAVLEGIKAGEPNITEEEWSRLKRELSAMGLISGNDLANTTNHVVVLGNMERSGDFFGPQGGAKYIGTIEEYFAMRASGTLNFEIEWTGDPLKYMEQWIQALRMGINEAPGRAGQAESYERLYDVVSKLLETAGGL